MIRSALEPMIRLLAGVGVFCVLSTLPGCGARSVGSPGGGSAHQVSQIGVRVITASDIEKFPTLTTVEEVLEWHAPGLHLRRRFEPGGNIAVEMLGLGVPLFVVDGVPLSNSDGSLGLNPRDIELIEIWKYGANGSQYGFRGANGVVLITTKRRGE